MVDEINEVNLQNILQRYGQTRLDQTKDLNDANVVDTTTEDNEDTPFKRAVKISQKLGKVTHVQWNQHWVQQLLRACEEAIKDAAADIRHLNNLDEFAFMAAANAVRSQLRKLIEQLDPPSEIVESEEFQELLELLWPKPKGSKSRKEGYKPGSNLKGSVKNEVKMQQLHKAIAEAAKRAQQRMQAKGSDARGASERFLAMDLEQMARFLRRKMRERTKKTGIKDPSKAMAPTGDETDAELEELRELQSLMELFSMKTLETMRAIREEIAPQWAPEQQPWLIANADRHVYSILLATIPESLFAETAAYQDIQDLRQNQAVYMMRAQDKLTEAAARQPDFPSES